MTKCLAVIFITFALFAAHTQGISVKSSSVSSNLLNSYNSVFQMNNLVYFSPVVTEENVEPKAEWFSMNLDFSDFQHVNAPFTKYCPNSYSYVNSENNLVCLTILGGNQIQVAILDASSDYSLVSQKNYNAEYIKRDNPSFFWGDYLVFFHENSGNVQFQVIDIVKNQQAYTVPAINTEVGNVSPTSSAFYFVTYDKSSHQTQFVTYDPSSKSQTVDFSLPVPSNFEYFQAMNQSSVFMGYDKASGNIEGLVGISLTKKLAGVPALVKNVEYFQKINDTHALVQHGTKGNTLSLYYVSQNLSVIEAGRVNLNNYYGSNYEAQVQFLGGSVAAVIAGANNEGSNGFLTLIVNLNTMQAENWDFGNPGIYPTQISLQNGSVVSLNSLGYYVGTSNGEFPSFTPQTFQQIYFNPTDLTNYWGVNFNTKSKSCSLTNFEPQANKIKTYTYTCPCQNEDGLVPQVTSVVGDPESSNFAFAYICGEFFVNYESKPLGPFTYSGFSYAFYPTSLLDVSGQTLNVLNVESENGAELVSFQFSNKTPNVKNLSPSTQYPSRYASKISEDIALFTMSSGQKSTIYVYQVSTGNFLQTITANYENPSAVYPLQVNAESSTPVEAALLGFYVNSPETYKMIVIDSSGSGTNLEQGEYIGLVSSNSAVLSNGENNFINYELIEVTSSEAKVKPNGTHFLRKALSMINH